MHNAASQPGGICSSGSVLDWAQEHCAGALRRELHPPPLLGRAVQLSGCARGQTGTIAASELCFSHRLGWSKALFSPGEADPLGISELGTPMAALILQSLCKAQSEHIHPQTALPVLLPVPTGSAMLDKSEFSVLGSFLVWSPWAVLHHTRDCCFHPPCKFRHGMCCLKLWGAVRGCEGLSETVGLSEAVGSCLPVTAWHYSLFLLGREITHFAPMAHVASPVTSTTCCPLPRQQPDHFCRFWGGSVPMIPCGTRDHSWCSSAVQVGFVQLRGSDACSPRAAPICVVSHVSRGLLLLFSKSKQGERGQVGRCGKLGSAAVLNLESAQG
ncbi:uncharacterized protein LOC121661449 [Corvus kubaryi]|uniref:uncharacterized protein LOC121661449 n=1 Tax=Corvus kubaryi TaxID=68294 RepID=UPI001C05116F|nr:uncharacterized protein LOC121661449 [Corvus kubaryi]